MERKNEHLNLALMQKNERNDFDNIRFVHNAIHDGDFSKINLTTSYANHTFPLPLYINAMTGGTKRAKEINEKLAIIANHFDLPIASGSLSLLLKDESLLDTYSIIKEKNPNGKFIANVGADKSYSEVEKIINLTSPDILQIHLNIPQEMVMVEGDRDFSKIESNIREIIANIKIPVIIKEVGFGMSRNTILKLKSLGANTIDVSGKGGTNFIQIENYRRTNRLDYLNDYGLSTVESLLEASNTNIDVLASGGIRNPFDVVKALALGAKAVGMSRYFLNLVVRKNPVDAIEEVTNFINEIKIIMTILGVKNIEELKNLELIVSESIYSYMMQRDIKKEILYRRK